MRILVVEDHPDTRDLLVAYLESQGLEVDAAATGPEALDLATQSSFDAIVLDLELAGMDGWSTARQLKARSSTRLVPIVAVSAHAFPEDEARAYESGCDAFVAKPFLLPDVLRAIRRLWSHNDR